MNFIDYELRNKRYSNSNYDLQRLVGKKFLGISYKISDKSKWKDTQAAYDVLLEWEDYIMKFTSPGKRQIPIYLYKLVNRRLENWYMMPNHACEMVMLYFEGIEEEINFNTYGGIEWEEIKE
ncbi:MAG: hypothetical protein FWH28_07835 [Clostridiales bacterium]|nr:hypothetical protein [Clostridiales bacterium]